MPVRRDASSYPPLDRPLHCANSECKVTSLDLPRRKTEVNRLTVCAAFSTEFSTAAAAATLQLVGRQGRRLVNAYDAPSSERNRLLRVGDGIRSQDSTGKTETNGLFTHTLRVAALRKQKTLSVFTSAAKQRASQLV